MKMDLWLELWTKSASSQAGTGASSYLFNSLQSLLKSSVACRLAATLILARDVMVLAVGKFYSPGGFTSGPGRSVGAVAARPSSSGFGASLTRAGTVI